MLNDKSKQDFITLTLDEDNIPDHKFIEEIEKYDSKLSLEIIELISKQAGIVTSDPRVYKLISLASQQYIEEIVSNTADSIISKKNNNKFLENKELVEVMKEKGIGVSQSSYYCDNLNINLDKNR